MKYLTGLIAAILLVISVAFFLWGQSQLSQATLGVGILAIACLFGIWARILQAASDHYALMDYLSKIRQGK